MLRFFSLAVLNLAVAGPVRAQPFSPSMAQGAGLYRAVRCLLSGPEREAPLDAAAAMVQARAEGRDDPAGWVDDHRDWAAHCVTFAPDRGIDVAFD